MWWIVLGALVFLAISFGAALVIAGGIRIADEKEGRR